MNERLDSSEYGVQRGRLGELYYHTRDAVAVIDEDWRIRGWNAAAERLIGFPHDGLEGQPFSALFASVEEFAELRQFLTATQSGGGVSEGATARIRSRAGRLFQVRCRLIRLTGADGATAVLIQEELREGEDGAAHTRLAELHHIADTAAGVMGETDPDKIAQQLTDLVKELLDADFTAIVRVAAAHGGFQVTAFNYNAPRELFPRDVNHPHGRGLLAAALLSRSVVRVSDVRRHPQAVGIPGMQHPPIGPFLAVPLLVNDRVVGELLAANRVGRRAFNEFDEAIATHIGSLATAALENARLHLEVAAKAAELETVGLRRRQMVAAIAHDLRTPTGAVLGYADLAGDQALPASQLPTVLNRIREQAGQLNRLVDDLSMASRMDAEHLSVQVEPVDAGRVLEELVADYRFRFPARSFELSGLPVPAVLADEVRLRQILTNLVDNALKYSPPNGCIHVEAGAQHRRWVELRVRDEGAGIDADEQSRIFEPFYRSRKSAQRTSGIGLGLTIAAGLAQAMNGELRLESRLGRGACFTVSLQTAS